MCRFPERTIPACLVRAAARDRDRVFLRYLEPTAPDAPAREVTFGGLRDLTARALAWLEAVGVCAGDRVLLLAENSPEWQAVAVAAQTLRAEPAALFASLAALPAQEIARRVSPRVLFVSTEAQWQKLAPIAEELARGGLRAVLSTAPLTGVPAGVIALTAAAALAEAALDREDFEARARAVAETDPFLLLFTSGTTGRQKGVRLCQRAIVTAIDGGAYVTGTDEHDVGLHLLPFGHIAGHDQYSLALAQGHGLIMVARRDDIPRGLALGPSYAFSVPLIYDRIRQQVVARIDGMPRPLRWLLLAALAAAGRVAVDGATGPIARLLALLARATIRRKLMAALGGRIRALFAGGAPVSEPLFRFFEGLGVPLVEMYGMTETAGLIALNQVDQPRRPGCAGRISPDHDVRIAEDGELLVRGPLLLSGFLEPADADGTFTDDGFLHTGDLVRLAEDGGLFVTGRKKHLLVLSTGKKVAPEPVETAIAAAAPFEGAVLIGEGRPFLSVAVFVAREELARIAARGKDAAEELLPRARAALAAFSEHEKPKQLLVIPGAPMDHPSLVTPTLKVRREALHAFLGVAIANLYATM